MHIYIYIGPGAQSKDINSLRTGKHLPNNHPRRLSEEEYFLG